MSGARTTVNQNDLVATGVATAPAAGAVLTSVTLTPAGTYDVAAVFCYGAVGDVAGNVGVYVNGVGLLGVNHPGGPNTPTTTVTVRVVSDGTTTVSLRPSSGGAAGCVYLATLIARRVA